MTTIKCHYFKKDFIPGCWNGVKQQSKRGCYCELLIAKDKREDIIKKLRAAGLSHWNVHPVLLRLGMP